MTRYIEKGEHRELVRRMCEKGVRVRREGEVAGGERRVRSEMWWVSSSPVYYCYISLRVLLSFMVSLVSKSYIIS